MTVVRHILLAVLTLAPLTAWGQVFTSPELRTTDGNANGLPSQSNFGAIAEAGYQEGIGPGFQPDQDVLLMQGDTAGQLPPQIPPEILAQQQQQLQQQMLQRRKSSTSRQYSSPVWQTSAKGGHFGIMGAIAQPGVYFHAEQRITLGELLQMAGGPTPAASSAVRIVRQGRGGMQAFLSPESKHEIMNGDVILLETKRPAGKSGLREYPAAATSGGAPASSNATSGASPSPIAYLAFVNLQPHPIVVPVPSDQATLQAVMKWLHQDEESPPFVRVIAPSPALRPSPGRPADQQLLENGSVLVFDPATIKRERLPAFPPVIGQVPTSDPAMVPAPQATSPAQLPDAAHPAQISPTPTQSQPMKPATTQPLRQALPATSHRGTRSAELQQQYGQSQPGLAPITNYNDAPYQGGPQTGGPLLMMPQSHRPSRPQATNPNSRQSTPPKRLNSQAEDQTTQAKYVGQPMSWQQRPAVGANVSQPEVNDFGVVQAHGEEARLNDEFAGPILELPQPVPNLVDAAPIAGPQPAQASTPATAPKLSSSSFSMRIVWFSMGSLLLLVVGLWCMTRWDRPRPIRATIPTSRASRFRTSAPPAPENAAPQLGLRILKHTGKSLAEAPSPMTPVTQPVPEPARAKPTAPAPTPGPTRTISREEQRLRELFHQTRPPQVTVPTAAPVRAKPMPLQPPGATRQPINVTPDELRQLTGDTTATVDKLVRAPSPMKSPVPPAPKRSDSPGNLLDRVLRAQQKR